MRLSQHRGPAEVGCSLKLEDIGHPRNPGEAEMLVVLEVALDVGHSGESAHHGDPGSLVATVELRAHRIVYMDVLLQLEIMPL